MNTPSCYSKSIYQDSYGYMTNKSPEIYDFSTGKSGHMMGYTAKRKIYWCYIIKDYLSS